MACSATQPPNGGFGRFQALHGNNHLAVWLRSAGYYTAMIGRYLNGYENQPRVPPGWSEWRAASSQAVYNYTLNENGTLVKYGPASAAFKQDVLTNKAVELVNRRTPFAQPFFLWLTYTAPHAGGPEPNPNPPGNCQQSAKPAPRHANAFDSEPLPRPPNFNEADVSDKPAVIQDRPLLNSSQISDIERKYRCRLESLLSVDEGVKKIIDRLRVKGELADTLLVFTSDNGYFHGEHRFPTDKGRIYEESIRVPLLMRGPGIPQGVDVDDLVINADLAPTIVDLANANPGLVMDGRSLIPVAQQPGIEQGRELLIEQPMGPSFHHGGLPSRRFGPSATCTPSTTPARTSSTTWIAIRSNSTVATPIPATHRSGRSSRPASNSCRTARVPAAASIRNWASS